MVQKQIDGAPFWVVEVEIAGRVAAWDDECVQVCNRIIVGHRERQFVFRNDFPVRYFAKDAVWLPPVQSFANSAEVSVVSRALVGVALVTKRLKI